MRALIIAGALAFGVCISSAEAQSPGSVESELNYAREYLEAGSWDYAMWGYEAVLRRDPDNAEAKEGYEKAKVEYEAKKAAQAAQVKAMQAPAPRPIQSRVAIPNQSKPVTGSKLSAQEECDRLFGLCWVTSKSPSCFIQKNMCYNRNGIK